MNLSKLKKFLFALALTYQVIRKFYDKDSRGPKYFTYLIFAVITLFFTEVIYNTHPQLYKYVSLFHRLYKWLGFPDLENFLSNNRRYREETQESIYLRRNSFSGSKQYPSTQKALAKATEENYRCSPSNFSTPTINHSVRRNSNVTPYQSTASKNFAKPINIYPQLKPEDRHRLFPSIPSKQLQGTSGIPEFFFFYKSLKINISHNQALRKPAKT